MNKNNAYRQMYRKLNRELSKKDRQIEDLKAKLRRTNAAIDLLSEKIARINNDIAYRYPELSKKELKVATLIQQGKSTTEISQILGIGKRTTETHRRNIRRKLGLIGKKVNLETYLMAKPGDKSQS